MGFIDKLKEKNEPIFIRFTQNWTESREILIKLIDMQDNYPIGAKDNPSAPYNEPLDVEHERFVSVTISFVLSESASPDTFEDTFDSIIEEKARDIVKKSSLSKLKEFNIDEVSIIND